MKRNHSIITGIILFCTTTILLGACDATKNTPASAAALNLAIDSSHWKFVANNMIPQYSGSRPVNGSYDVVCSNNKLTVYLPYFGKADGNANTLSGRGPLDFTSADFSMDKQQNKKGKWTITIIPKDYREVQSMTFTFYNNGSASLGVTMGSRTPVSFTGLVEVAK
jgi:hypothetical protein